MRSSISTAVSSAGLRLARTTDGAASTMRAESAWAPLRPWAMPNSMRVPARTSVVPSGSAEACRYTSWPSSATRNPKPFEASNHFTLPKGTALTSVLAYRRRPAQGAAPRVDSRPAPEPAASARGYGRAGEVYSPRVRHGHGAADFVRRRDADILTG